MTTDATRPILRAYRNLELSDANEAATRLKVIDRIPREVLHWSDDDIHPEEHVTEDGQTTYTDYILRTANAAIVVEAKKAGAAFKVPASDRRVKLTNAFLQSDLGAAIVQARDYARKLAIDFAVATNGSVWAIFPAQRHDQVKFHDSTALVFWSLDDALNAHYQEFFDLLSRDSVISGSLETALLGRVANQIENRKLRSFFATNTKASLTNPAFRIIEEEVITAFSDSIVDLDDESFERCYVTTPDSIKFDHKIRMHVAKRGPIVAGEILRPLKDVDERALVARLEQSARARRPLALLLLGAVGAGKTTFLHYIRNIRLKGLFQKPPGQPYPHWLRLDFLTHSQDMSGTQFIYRSLRDYIGQDGFLSSFEQCIRHAYAGEIQALRAGPLFALRGAEDKINERISDLILKDYEAIIPYVDKIIAYATRYAAFYLAIDNIDQIEDEQAQSKLFLEALTIARRLSLNLVLAIRQATFAKHRTSPSIDAFDFEVVQVDPPRITSVLSKRFALVRHLSNGKRGEFIAENGARVRVENAAQIVDLLQGSVLGTEIGSRIEVLATEDVRLALRMTREFLERGYTNPGRAIEFHRSTGKYVLPKHEAFRAIMLGTQTVYNEEFSAIGNPFDSRLSVTQAQLLRLYILGAVVGYASESGFRFVDGSLIAESLRRIGFGDSLTGLVLVDLCRHRFLFTASHGDASIASSYVPSRLGGYIVRELIANFTFLENTLFDTYIADPNVWQELRAMSYQIEAERNTVKRILIRVGRVRKFYDYMHQCMRPLIAQSQRRGLAPVWCSDVMEERAPDLRRELGRVLESARRNYGPGRRADPAKSHLYIDDEDLSNV
jgi:GTPase SAR1 family protein